MLFPMLLWEMGGPVAAPSACQRTGMTGQCRTAKRFSTPELAYFVPELYFMLYK